MKKLVYALPLMAVPLVLYAQDAQEDDDEGFLASLIEDNLSGVSRTVDITGFEGALSSEATLESLTIADEEGIWLTLEDVVLDWNRSALLRGRISVQELSAARIVVARAPISDGSGDTAPSPEAEPFSLPELPVSVQLDELQIDRIELGESFLGEPVNVSLTGNASLADGEGEVNVTATRLDDTSGEFEIAGSYSNDSEVLALNLNVEEAADGIAARLLGVPGNPALGLTVAGEGPVSTFSADIALATDGQDRVIGQFARTLENDLAGFSLDVGGDLTPLLEAEYQGFFGTDMSLVAAGRQLADGRFDLSDLDLQAQRINLTGSALIGAEGWPERMQLVGTINDPSGEPVLLPIRGPETRVSGVSLDVDYDEAVSEDWTADFTVDTFARPGLEIGTLELSGGGLLRPAEGDQTGEVTVDLTYAASGLTLDDPGSADAFGDEISGVIQARKVEGSPTNIDAITLRGPGLEADIEGVVDTSGDQIEIDSTIALTVAALDRFSTLAGRALAGAADVSIDSTIDPLNGLYDITVTGTTDDLQVDVPQADPLLAGNGTIDIIFQRDGDGTRLEQFDIATDETTITATADITSGVSSAEIDATVRDVSLIEPSLSGPLTVTGTASRDTAGLITFDVDGDGPDASIQADGTATDTDPGYSITANVVAELADLDTYATLADRPLDGAATATVAGTLTTEGLLFDGTISARTTDLQTGIADLDPLLAGTGTIAGGIARNSDTAYALRDFQMRLPDVRLDADGAVDIDGPIDAEFDLRLTDVGLVLDDISGPVTANGTAQRGADGIANIDVAATAPGITADVDVAVAPETNAITGTITADVEELGDYADLIGQPLAGAVEADVSGTLVPDLSTFDVTLNVQTDDLETGIAQADTLLAGRGTIQADASRSAEGIDVPMLQVETPQMSLDAVLNATDEGRGSGTYTARINDMSLLADGLSGPATAEGDASQAADGTWSVTSEIAAPGVTANADVDIAPDTNEISGSVLASVDDLSDYQEIIGQPVGGNVQADVRGTLLPDLSAFDLALNVVTDDLETGIAQADTLLAGRGTVRAEASRTAEGIDVPTLDVDTPQMTLDATLNASNEGRGSGTYDAQINDIGVIVDGLSGPVTATGDADQATDGTWAVTSDLSAPGATATADLSIAPETNEISGDVQASVNDLAAYQDLIGQPVSGGVQADVSGSLLPDLTRFDADISVETRDIGIGNASADLLTRGLGNLDASVSRTADGIAVRGLDLRTNNVTLTGSLDTTNAGASQGDFSARLRDVGLFTDQLSGPVTADGTASVAADGTIGLDIDGTGPGGIAVTADGTVQSGGTLAMDVNGVVPLALANNALAPRSITGDAQFDLSINGPAALDSVSGDISVNGARLSAPTLNQALENITGTVNLNNSRAQVSIAGDVQSGGSVSVQGPVGLTGNLLADLAVDVNDVVLRDPELYESSIDGSLSVTGPLTGGARILGRFDLGETEIQVPSSGVGALGDLPDVVHVGDDGAVIQTRARAGVTPPGSASEATATSSGPGYPLDVVINAPSRIFIRGRGLDAELGGTLSIGGTTNNIIPVGQFALVRGRLDILQQRFDLTEGVASLQGDFSPYVRLVAETETDTGTVVSIIVEGPAGAPEVSFESTPSLPQDEVLAQLIFGRDLSEISPFQAVQLAAAVGTLAGRGGGGLIDGFRQDLGLDDFDVTTDEDGNAAVRAGAYLSENVYTDVTINAEGDTEINLNLDITSEITAKGTVDQDGETSLGVFFERDY